MPSMTLLPDGTGLSSFLWAASSGTRHDCLDDDNGDTSYVQCQTSSVAMIITFANPSVPEAIIDFDETVTVTFTSSGRSTNRTTDSTVDISFQAPTVGFAETCSYNRHASSYETIGGTPRTTHDGTHPWTYANLQDLQMICTKGNTAQVRLSYLALVVDYTSTVVADNATFFGANF